MDVLGNLGSWARPRFPLSLPPAGTELPAPVSGPLRPATSSDGVSLSPEAQSDDGRDQAIDDYFHKLAADQGNTPDAQHFSELMAYITKELKDIDKMDWQSAHQKFGDTIHSVQEKVNDLGLGNKEGAPKEGAAKGDDPGPKGSEESKKG